MAASKNANKHQKVDVDKPRELMGKKVYYMGNGVPSVCPSCGIKRFRGMVSEHKGKLFCSELCVQKAS